MRVEEINESMCSLNDGFSPHGLMITNMFSAFFDCTSVHHGKLSVRNLKSKI